MVVTHACIPCAHMHACVRCCMTYTTNSLVRELEYPPCTLPHSCLRAFLLLLACFLRSKQTSVGGKRVFGTRSVYPIDPFLISCSGMDPFWSTLGRSDSAKEIDNGEIGWIQTEKEHINFPSLINVLNPIELREWATKDLRLQRCNDIRNIAV